MEAPNSRELLARWLARDLDAEGIAQLVELLRENPALLEEAARHKSLDRLLQLAALDAGEEAFIAEVAARCGISSLGVDLTRGVKRRLQFRRWAFLAAAACLLGAAMLAVLWQYAPVAEVARLESVEWAPGEEPMVAGEKLSRGRFALAKGFAALRFPDGAELLVEGPAELELVSSSVVRMRSGNAFAHIPEAAIGFTVEGPTGRVVDKGTDFGVRVSEGGMEVHVLKGLVEAGQGRKLQSLRENEGLRMSALEVNSIPADAGRFRTGLPPKPERPIGWIRWSFDEKEGHTTLPNGGGLAEPSAEARLTAVRENAAGPQWTTGQFGSALYFDGADDYVQTDFAGISGDAPRTVAFWAKVPKEFEPKNGYSMVCWGSSQELTEGWQISVNPKEISGPIGRLRVSRIGGPIIGTTDLRDDRWHHIAVIFYGGGQPGHSTQVLIYIDGELEPTERKGVINVRTKTSGPDSRKVAFGLNIGPANPDPTKPPNWRVFRGCLDEVYICDAALNQGQVRDLMTRNQTALLAPLPSSSR